MYAPPASSPADVVGPRRGDNWSHTPGYRVTFDRGEDEIAEARNHESCRCNDPAISLVTATASANGEYRLPDLRIPNVGLDVPEVGET
jgi:hypothetical protein